MIYVAAIKENSDGSEDCVAQYNNSDGVVVFKADTPEDTSTISFKTKEGLMVYITITPDIIHNLNSINIKAIE